MFGENALNVSLLLFVSNAIFIVKQNQCDLRIFALDKAIITYLNDRCKMQT